MEIVKTSEVEPIHTPEGVMRGLVFGTAASLIHLEAPPGIVVPPHAHPNEALVFCLSGNVELTLAGKVIELSADSAAKVPAGESIGMRNPGPSAAKMLLISAPPVAASFQELKARIQAAQSDHGPHKDENSQRHK